MNTPPLQAHIDHFVLAAADLEQACAQFESATGVRPVFGGAHPGRGTHNALVGFDDSSYLEIIAPDPAQASNSMTAPMMGLAQPKLIHWAVRCAGLADVSARLKVLGWTPTPVRPMHRTPPGGTRLDWELFGLRRPPLTSLLAELGIHAQVLTGDQRMSLTLASSHDEVRYDGVSPAGFTLGD